MTNSITDKLKEAALRLGFSACGVARALPAASEAEAFDRWIARGYQAGMGYMGRYRDVRLDPALLVEGARSVVSVALNYYPPERQGEDAPRVAYYAYGKDYHIVMKERLGELEKVLAGLVPGQRSRCFVDSAPLLERYWAWKAGLGWIGKNGCLILQYAGSSTQYVGGSYFFLGEIVTTALLSYDTPRKDRCGTCRRCLDACHTGALVAPRVLDANKCLSYLTIEHKGEIPEAEAAFLGNKLFGCDTCQLVCPWNRFAVPTRVEEFFPSASLLAMKKEDLKTFSKKDYNRIFAQSAVKRAKYEGLIRTIQHLKD